MDDRTLLTLLLVVAALSLVVNGYTLSEVWQQASQAPAGVPPPNESHTQGMIQSHCYMGCSMAGRECQKSCTSCPRTTSGDTCRKRCEVDSEECLDPCYRKLEGMLKEAQELGKMDVILSGGPCKTKWVEGISLPELSKGIHSLGFGPCLPCLETRDTCMAQCTADEEVCPDACFMCDEEEITCMMGCYYSGQARCYAELLAELKWK